MGMTLLLWKEHPQRLPADRSVVAARLLADEPVEGLGRFDFSQFRQACADGLGIDVVQLDDRLILEPADFSGYSCNWLTVDLGYSAVEEFHAVARAARQLQLTLFDPESGLVDLEEQVRHPQRRQKKPDTFALIIQQYLIPVLGQHGFALTKPWRFQRRDGDRMCEVVCTAPVDELRIEVGIGFRSLNTFYREYCDFIRSSRDRDSSFGDLRFTVGELTPPHQLRTFPFLIDAERMPSVGREAAKLLDETLAAVLDRFHDSLSLIEHWRQNVGPNWQEIAVAMAVDGRFQEAVAFLDEQRLRFEQKSRERYNPRVRGTLIDIKWLRAFLEKEMRSA